MGNPKKTKIVDYVNEETNEKLKVLLPVDVPDSEAAIGIPLSVDMSQLYSQPFASQLQQALWDRGVIIPADFEKPGVHRVIREAIQQVNRMNIEDIVQFATKGVKPHGRN